MRIYFSWNVTLIGLLLMAGMFRMSYRQWERHKEKQQYVAELNDRLALPIAPVQSLLSTVADPVSPDSWEALVHRRVLIEGDFDYEREMLLRNRNFEGMPGVHALTPLKLANSDFSILVDRGFVPLSRSSKEQRTIYQRQNPVRFYGLVKQTVQKKFLGPSDPATGHGHPWVESWLRPDIDNIRRQLPYPILGAYVEIIDTPDGSTDQKALVVDNTGREDILFLPSGERKVHSADSVPDLKYPIAVFDTVVPPGRHLGYVFEWAGMALVTFLICLVLQFRPPKKQSV